MRRLPVLAWVATLLAGCGADPPGRGLEVRLEAGAAEVPFGKAFPVEVVRAWDEGLLPRDWSDAALAPLVVRPVGVEKRTGAGRVVETRRFRAYAFALGEVRVPPPRFEAEDPAGGPPRSAVGKGFAVRVIPALDPKDPGPPEPPGGPLPLPRPRWPLAAAIAAALLAAAGLVAGARRARAARAAAALPPPPAPAEAPGERALRRAAALRGRIGSLGARAFHEDAASILREFLGDAFRIPASFRTTEEIAADPALARAAGEERRRAFASALARCDLVKFAAAAPPAPERERLLDDLEALVRAGGGAP